LEHFQIFENNMTNTKLFHQINIIASQNKNTLIKTPILHQEEFYIFERFIEKKELKFSGTRIILEPYNMLIIWN